VVAVVRLREGATFDVATAGLFLAERVADYKRPRRIVLCPGPLPRTAMGKLDKAALRNMLDPDPDPYPDPDRDDDDDDDDVMDGGRRG
jgi:acyl-CoA synthetase (AMP-forming)/AMP-acid ligase II